jgi:hypothetical protein
MLAVSFLKLRRRLTTANFFDSLGMLLECQAARLEAVALHAAPLPEHVLAAMRAVPSVFLAYMCL